MKQTFILIIVLLTLLSSGTYGQRNQISVAGKVIHGETGSVIPGVTVRNPSGPAATKTDRDGLFRIPVGSLPMSLSFSAVGFGSHEQVFVVLPDSLIVVRLWPEEQVIDEVIVSTGYQEISQQRATGSFEYIDATELNKNVGMDIISRLENLTTSIYFDKRSYNFNEAGTPDHAITIHGISSLRAPAENRPLIIVDNFPYEGDIANINPDDVAGITVLKDAAASSIWGARAGNGVIVITTKKAQYDERLRISFNHRTTVTAKPDLFARPMIDNADVIAIEKMLFEEGFYQTKINNRAKPALPPTVEVLIAMQEGKISEEEGDRLIASYEEVDIRRELLDHVYRNALHEQYSLNIGNGSTRHSYNLSVGYDRLRNNRPSSHDNRLTIRLDNSLKLGKNTELQAGLVWTKEGHKRPSGISTATASYSNDVVNFPYIRLADDDGNPLPIPYKYRTTFLDTAGQGALLDWHLIPLMENQIVATTDLGQEITANAVIRHRLTGWLNAELRYQYQQSGLSSTTVEDLDAYATRDQINRGTELIGGNIVYHFPYGAVFRTSDGRRTGHNGRIQLNVRKQWTNWGELNAIAGFEARHQQSGSFAFSVMGYDPETLTYANSLDYTDRFPVFGNLAASGSLTGPINNFSETVNRYISVFANADYAYDRRYVISVSARRDASNLFGVNVNNRWTPLWSAGFAWNLGNERFLNWNLLDHLKIRTSYGFSGNVDNSMSALTTIRYTNNAPNLLVPLPAAAISSPPNPELRWELVKKYNVGMDFSLFGGRLSGNVDHYLKNTEDLLHSYYLDPTTGSQNMIMNVGNTKSKGTDIRISGVILQGRLSWKAVGMISHNNNWITKSYQVYNGPSLYTTPGSLSTLEGGMAFPAYSYRWGGLDPETGEARGIVNGAPSKDYSTITSRDTPLEALVLHGSGRPLYFGSLRNEISYGNVSFSFSLSYKLAYYFRREGLNYDALFNTGRGHIDYYQRWQQPGDESRTHVPAMLYPNTSAYNFYQRSEVLMEKGDHIRLRDIRLDYRFGRRASSRLPGLDLFLHLDNCGIIWRANRHGLDPEIHGNIPQPRRLTAGINLAIN